MRYLTGMVVCVVVFQQVLVSVGELEVCPGDTRYDRRCNQDLTHRVCAKIGTNRSSFWHFTGQTSWCGTIGFYGGKYGNLPRCPEDKPTWCICKWATAKWMAGENCSDDVEIVCSASDICDTAHGLFYSYRDFSVDLKPARECVKRKCPKTWARCEKKQSEERDTFL